MRDKGKEMVGEQREGAQRRKGEKWCAWLGVKSAGEEEWTTSSQGEGGGE